MVRRQQLRDDQTAILWASLATVIVWFVPILQFISLPLEYLNAHTHEMCHAITAVITGGHVDHIVVRADGSGVTPLWGGNILLIGSAGYVGASIIGVLILICSRTADGARLALRLLAAALAGSMILWVRGDTVGIVSGIAWVSALFALASFLPPKGALFAATFVGIQQCLHSILALVTVMDLSFFTKEQDDAMILQGATHVPAAFWATAWMGFSLLLMAVALRSSWRSRR